MIVARTDQSDTSDQLHVVWSETSAGDTERQSTGELCVHVLMAVLCVEYRGLDTVPGLWH